MEWQADILGEDFESYSFRAAGPDGVSRTATLVRHFPRRSPVQVRPEASGAMPPSDFHPVHPTKGAVLFLHGWSDYFFNTELAEFWTARGFSFYALDMHNHGRSLQPDTPGGYVAHLEDYDAEIAHAVGLIRAGGAAGESGASPARSRADRLPLMLIGHSTGGLVAALWASAHPDEVQFLILNSPWLEMHGSSLVRQAARTMVEPLARLRPEAVLKLPERGFYYRSISSSAEGEWFIDDKYRPPMAFPVRAGWLRAVLAGHAKVARGLRLDMPVLVMMSRSSANGMVWQEVMKRSDSVLDVNTMAFRAMTLGRTVTLERIEGALHDVFLSAPPVRADAYARLDRWLRGYVETEGRAASTAPP
jgi:alpha-beta hydrolase superfamily lysophospholipase